MVRGGAAGVTPFSIPVWLASWIRGDVPSPRVGGWAGAGPCGFSGLLGPVVRSVAPMLHAVRRLSLWASKRSLKVWRVVGDFAHAVFNAEGMIKVDLENFIIQ